MINSLAETRKANVEQKVRTEQVRLLFSHGIVAFLINAAVALLLVVLVGPHVPSANVRAWTSVYALAWLLRGSLYVARWRNPDALSLDSWTRLFGVGTLAAGCTWGLTSLWLFPPALTDRFFVALAIMGLAAGAAASLSCVRGMYPLYVVPAFLPVALRFAFEGGAAPAPVIGLALLYAGGMSIAAMMNYRLLSSSLHLRFQNLALAEQLERVASHDALTALPNRLMFEERLKNALLRARRSREPIAVAFIDCDGFKGVNDAYGHAAGDEFLTQFAQTLVGAVRETDTVARVGGDEFIIVMEGCGEEDEARRAVVRLRERALKLISVAGTAIVPSFSIGVARFPENAHDAGDLVRIADQAMYEAKRRGGNEIQFATAKTDSAGVGGPP